MQDIREPDEKHVSLDPASCEVMAGHQHVATDITELAQSISDLGQINPIQVIAHADGRRLVVSGRRRWMACTSLDIPVIANIWHCAEDNINLEVFARSVRIAENLQRKDPSAMDVAWQLHGIRSERGLGSAREISKHVGMSETKVKEYLSFFTASPHLQELAQTHALSMSVMLELTKCEKVFGVAKSRKLAAQVIEGTRSTSSLAKLRDPSKPAKKARKARGSQAPDSQAPDLDKSCDAFLQLAAATPSTSRARLDQFIADLTKLLELPGSDEVTTEV